MRVKHTVPSDESDDHELSQHCPCDPDQRVDATPLKRPLATVIHHPIVPRRTEP